MSHKTVAPPHLPLNASNETYRDRSDYEGVPIGEMMARERRVPASGSLADGLPYHRMMGTVEREPVREVVYTAVQLREMIQRTNDYLANSTPEFAIVRQDRCQELEYFLIRTGNMNGYDFLDLNVKDASRRRYRFAPRLLVTSIGN